MLSLDLSGKRAFVAGVADDNGYGWAIARALAAAGALLAVIRLQLDGDRVVGEERLLKELGARIRDVRVGPDGYLYVLTDAGNGKLLQVGLDTQ